MSVRVLPYCALLSCLVFLADAPDDRAHLDKPTGGAVRLSIQMVGRLRMPYTSHDADRMSAVSHVELGDTD
jgi:hypothetical protein